MVVLVPANAQRYVYRYVSPQKCVHDPEMQCILLWDLRHIKQARDDLGFRGIKGTTDTQASSFALFSGDYDKLEYLDELVTTLSGFQYAYPVIG